MVHHGRGESLIEVLGELFEVGLEEVPKSAQVQVRVGFLEAEKRGHVVKEENFVDQYAILEEYALILEMLE